MQRRKKTLLAKQTFLATSNLTIDQFIPKLDNKLTKKKLMIVNSPYLDIKNLAQLQKSIRKQEDQLEEYAFICPTTEGLLHLSPLADKSGSRQSITTEQVSEYYVQQANITLKEKNTTCVGLCAVVLALSKEILKKHNDHSITVDICELKNWSHTIIRITQTNQNNEMQQLFYDPWCQRCYTTTPNEPKVFSAEKLGIEMEQLISQTKMIQHTEKLLDMKTQQPIVNIEKSYDYLVVCSTGNFTNPTQIIAGPQTSSSYCLLS